MNFGEAVLSCFKKYARFSGRSPRSELWYWRLFIILCHAALVAAVSMKLEGDGTCADLVCVVSTPSVRIVRGLMALALLVPGFAVDVRRLHDVDRSGWWLLTIIPPLYWFFIKGTAGPNRFGPDPLAAKDRVDSQTTGGTL